LVVGARKRREISEGLVMEPTMDAVAGSETKPLGAGADRRREDSAHLDEVVRATVDETLNALLDAEADVLCGARRYERTEERKDMRAGNYERRVAPSHDARRKSARSTGSNVAQKTC
jgi:Transposase, Mutator family